MSGVGNRAGIIKTNNLQMNVGTSRGFMDNKSAGHNTEVLDLIAGSIQERRQLIAWNPAALVDDTWTHIPMPSNIASQIGEAAFDEVIRYSNVVKILCCRIRALANTPGSGGIIQFQLRKGGSGAALADELLQGSISVDDSVATVSNASGVGKGLPQSPVVGMDEDPISLWARVDATVDETDMDVEILVVAQMVPDQPPAEIIET